MEEKTCSCGVPLNEDNKCKMHCVEGDCHCTDCCPDKECKEGDSCCGGDCK
ncbi:MAG: hypothetical protein HOE80_00620 [Candidatus Magasanikbacteria bacterium]|jgi:hypothetical protein|nr:hypothetical protein [Candidatus Magasanikbacteria bacterium]MBT4071212.1 hypothetical protein [Candidatus Magasanikbacteria bacterium]